jgi:hypothetical protein
MTWGPGPTCHTSWPEHASPHKEHATAPRLCAPLSSPQPTVKKANRHTRSVQPPHDYAPLHLRRNQRSRRRTAAQGACNRPTVVRPLGFDWWSNLCHGGPDPHVTHPVRQFLGAKKSHRRSRQYHTSSRPPQKMEKLNFQNQCSDSRHLAHGPTKPLSAEVTGQSAAGAGVVVGVTKGGPAAITPMGAQKQRIKQQPDFGPTCSLVSSPKAGPGATVGTPNQGYPLLQYEDAVPI